MAFDPALPALDTKLRLAPGVIQDNWEAIEKAQSSFKPYAINLNNRTPLGGVTDDPTAIATAYITYCKADSKGNPELFGMNTLVSPATPSNAVQLTKGTPVAAAAGSTFLPGGMILAWGQSATGAVPIVVASMTTIYQVVATVNDTSGTPGDRNIAINSKTGNKFTVYSSSSGQVNWIAIGV